MYIHTYIHTYMLYNHISNNDSNNSWGDFRWGAISPGMCV